jgi:hypothetical protein
MPRARLISECFQKKGSRRESASIEEDVETGGGHADVDAKNPEKSPNRAVTPVKTSP